MSGITKQDNMISYDGRSPYHNLGTVYPKGKYTAEEAYRLSKLDWDVQVGNLRREIVVQTPDGPQIIMGKACTSARIITRSNPEHPNDPEKDIELGACGPVWSPLQNKELFDAAAPFIESDLTEIETAGSLRMGRDVWVSLFIKDDSLGVTPEDKIRKRVLFTVSHDGNRAVKAGMVPERVECLNSLSSNEMRGHMIIIPHTKNVSQNFIDVVSTIDVINKKFLVTMAKYRQLTKVVLNEEQVLQYFDRVLCTRALERSVQGQLEALEESAPNTSAAEIADFRARRKRAHKPAVKEALLDNYRNAPGAQMDGAKGTAWGAYNAVTYYLSHQRGDAAKRLRDQGLSLGTESTNAQALNLALALI